MADEADNVTQMKIWSYTCGTDHGVFLMKPGERIGCCPCGKPILPAKDAEAFIKDPIGWALGFAEKILK